MSNNDPLAEVCHLDNYLLGVRQHCCVQAHHFFSYMNHLPARAAVITGAPHTQLWYCAFFFLHVHILSVLLPQILPYKQHFCVHNRKRVPASRFRVKLHISMTREPLFTTCRCRMLPVGYQHALFVSTIRARPRVVRRTRDPHSLLAYESRSRPIVPAQVDGTPECPIS